MLKSVLFGLTMAVVLTGCGQYRIQWVATEVVVPGSVVWYPTYQECCYFYGNGGWVWDYHSWHYHHHHGRHHEGYNRYHTPRRYLYRHYVQPQYVPEHRQQDRRDPAKKKKKDIYRHQ